MDRSGSVKFTDLKKLVAEHLKNGLGIDLVITYAEHVETANHWKVDVEFKMDASSAPSATATITLENKSGEVKTFYEVESGLNNVAYPINKNSSFILGLQCF